MEPPIELDELMERIRAATRDSAQGLSQPGSALPPLPEPVPMPPPPAAPAGAWPGQDDLAVALAEAASMLPRARQKTEVRAGVPTVLRSLFRNQGGFNGILVETFSRLLDANRQLQQQNVQLQARVAALEQTAPQRQDWAVAMSRAQEQQREWMQAVEASLFQASSPYAELTRQVKSVDGHANRLGTHLKNLQAQVDDQGVRYESSHEQYRQAAAYQETLSQNTRRLEERQHNDASFFKNQLWLLQRATQRPPADDTDKNSAPAPGSIAPGEHDLDALYLAFEEVMRGNRSAVKAQAAVYLPHIVAANAGTPERPVLDLGCGRGEWLEILGENGRVASGVDLNVCMVDVCRERNLPVTLADAIDHLRAMPDASCGAITAFHFIEHLPFPVLVGFLRECRRVVQPDGVVIFETPNPYNVLVGSGYFYHDFTHQRPLPSASTKFLVEQLGFSKAEILPLHPWDEAAKVHGEGDKALQWRFNELFYGPQDYALIATP